MDRLYAPLMERIGGVVYTPDQFFDEHHTNFGNIHHWTPRFVVEPKSADDVVAVVRFAREHRLQVSTRGSAHSQSELAISGRRDPARHAFDVEASLQVDDEERDRRRRGRRGLARPGPPPQAPRARPAGADQQPGRDHRRHALHRRHRRRLVPLRHARATTSSRWTSSPARGRAVTCGPDREPELFWHGDRRAGPGRHHHPGPAGSCVARSR